LYSAIYIYIAISLYCYSCLQTGILFLSYYNIIYFSYFILNFSLYTIIYKYLISLLIIISIKLYLSLIARFVDLDSLIIKFIVILSYNNLDNF